jgi:guanylate kinase
LDIDVNGALHIKKIFAPEALTIFVHPGSIDILEKRLIARGTETDASLEKRIKRAEEEMSKSHLFDAIIYNEELVASFHKIEQIANEYLGHPHPMKQ